MVIELKASTRRSTYLAGESVKVEVKISNIIQNTARYFNTTNSNSRHPSNQTINDAIKSEDISPITSNAEKDQAKNNENTSNQQFNSINQQFNTFNINNTQQHNKSPNFNKNSIPNVINTTATNCISSVDSDDFNRPERVAWVSVYLHCECIVNRNKVAVDNITAALAPVKSVLQQQSPHDFENSSHVFHENGERAEGERVPVNGHAAQEAQKSLKETGKETGDKQGKDTDSGVGGLAGKAFPKTSLAPDRDSHGICVLQTPAQILLCDLTLKPGESKSIVYREKIPVDAPPSYAGSLLKYSYKLTVSIQRVGGSIRQVRIPFRVLVLYGLCDYQGADEGTGIPSNPFLESSASNGNNGPGKVVKDGSVRYDMSSNNELALSSSHHNSNLLDLASDLLNRITAKRRPLVYKIANANGVIGSFSIPKTSYRLGEDIVGVFDFCGNVPCVQLQICLQMEEQVTDEFKKRNGQPNSVISFRNQICHCLFTKKMAIVVPIPLHVSPEFMTEIVILRWRLHFEFTTSKEPLEGQVLDDVHGDTMWQGPFQMKTNGMCWDLPMKVLPTVPALAESATTTDCAVKIVF